MRKPVWLAGLAVWALAASPAFAQPQQRDHRKADQPKADQPKNERVPAVRGDRPVRPAPTPAASDFMPKEGAAGTVVTIRGRMLGQVTAVVFGGREIKFDKAGPREITFTVPRLRGFGNQAIALRHPGGDIAVGTFDMKRGERVPATRGGDVAEPTEPPPPAPGPPGPPPHAGDHGKTPPGPGRRNPRNRWAGLPVVSGFAPAYGNPGTEVTIRGRNFGPGLKVIYNGAEVPAKKIAGEEITFIVPKGKGDGLIALEGGGGRRQLVVGNFDNTRKWDAKERKRLRDEMKKRAEERWKERQAELAKTKAEREAALIERERELEQTREERRRKRAEEIKARWEAAFLASVDAQAEIALHAERMARLERMRRLAEVDDHDGLVVRIDVTIERENNRHDRRMETLKANFTNE